MASELPQDTSTVFTTDRADFAVYRLKGRTAFRILPETHAARCGAQGDGKRSANGEL